MSDTPRHPLPGGLAVPDTLIENLARWDGRELAPNWLETVPDTIANLCDRWQITIDPVIPRSSMTLVLLGTSAKLGPVVIKSSPIAPEFASEARALEIAGGANVSRLYDVDHAHSAMVVERIMPGTPLKQVPMADERATRLAADTVRTFWQPVDDPKGLWPLRQWCRDLLAWESDPEVIPDDLIAHAREVAERRLAGQDTHVLLHGDFHHDNLLRRENGAWAIIDPKGLIGDPAFEVVTWLWNPEAVNTRADFAALTSRRLDIFAETWGTERRVLAEWGFFGAVLSACWYGHQPGHDAGRAGVLTVARTIESLL